MLNAMKIIHAANYSVRVSYVAYSAPPLISQLWTKAFNADHGLHKQRSP